MSITNSESSYIKEFEKIVKYSVSRNSSDIHLINLEKPFIRVNGVLENTQNNLVVTDNMIIEIMSLSLSEDEISTFKSKKDFDYSFIFLNNYSLRVNVIKERTGLSMTIRIISKEIPSLDKLKFNPLFKNLIEFNQGLILITGPTGSGKSTTMASLLNEVNIKYSKKIITIEDPIEFIFTTKKSIFSQRNVGKDTESFSTGLKHALRQDPDIIMVGEIRDKETAEIVIQASMTGHLVIATLHTISAAETINRLIDMFPDYDSNRVRSRICASLIGIISQILVPRFSGGRIAVHEFLLMDDQLKEIIYKNKLEDIYSYMQSSDSHKGFTQVEDFLRLLKQREIKPEIAKKFAYSREEMEKKI